MMKRTLLSGALALLLVAPAFAQTEKPASTTPKTAAKQTAPRRTQPAAQPVNIRVDLVITDQGGPGDASKKLVSMIVADQNRALIRTHGNVGQRAVELNVDANAAIVSGDTIRLTISLQYRPRPEGPQAEPERTQFGQLNQQQTLIVTSGKPIVISQAADPASDRRITAELTATILK